MHDRTTSFWESGSRIAAGAAGLLAVAAISATLVSYATFDRFPSPREQEIRDTAVAVVFTGQFERVDAALRLLNDGLVKRLYVSGVNAGAGISPEGFIAQFAARNRDIPDVKRLVQCCIAWGTRAETTIQNANDAKCWIERQRIDGSILLITSRLHMARARMALMATLPNQTVVTYPVPDGAEGAGRATKRLREFAKLIALDFVVHIPWVATSSFVEGPFSEGCPGAL